MDLRDVVIEDISEVGRERERSMAIMVLWIESIVVWKVEYGEVDDGASVWV